MKVLIIEDEAPAYRRLNDLLVRNYPEIEVVEVIDAVSEAVKWFKHHSSPDLIFSDIQLADGLSFEIFKQATVNCPIIFTTAYDAYMLEAFKTNGIDYLLKPIEAEDLSRSIEKFKLLKQEEKSPDIKKLIEGINESRHHYKQRFLVKVGSKLLPLNISNILFFRSQDGATEIMTDKGKTLIIDQTLDELEKELDPELFFRINRQYLAQVDSIHSIHQYFKGKLKVILSQAEEEEVLVSREKARSFKAWMNG